MSAMESMFCYKCGKDKPITEWRPDDHVVCLQCRDAAGGRRIFPRCRSPRCRSAGKCKGGWCKRHLHNKQCIIKGCTNVMRSSSGLCDKHGNTYTICSVEGCKKIQRVAGYCGTHTPATRAPPVMACAVKWCASVKANGPYCKRHKLLGIPCTCGVKGCENGAIKGTKCYEHARPPPRCAANECHNLARFGCNLCGVCREAMPLLLSSMSIELQQRGPKNSCLVKDCPTVARVKLTCGSHNLLSKTCAIRTCKCRAIRGGMCRGHVEPDTKKCMGGDGKCTGMPLSGNLCVLHGGIVYCKETGCEMVAKDGGVCGAHEEHKCESIGCFQCGGLVGEQVMCSNCTKMAGIKGAPSVPAIGVAQMVMEELTKILGNERGAVMRYIHHNILRHGDGREPPVIWIDMGWLAMIIGGGGGLWPDVSENMLKNVASMVRGVSAIFVKINMTESTGTLDVKRVAAIAAMVAELVRTMETTPVEGMEVTSVAI